MPPPFLDRKPHDPRPSRCWSRRARIVAFACLPLLTRPLRGDDVSGVHIERIIDTVQRVRFALNVPGTIPTPEH